MNKNPLDVYLKEYEELSKANPNVQRATIAMSYIIGLREDLSVNVGVYQLYPKMMQMADSLGMKRTEMTAKMSQAYNKLYAFEAATKTALDNTKKAAKHIESHMVGNPGMFPLDTAHMTPY